MRIGFATDLMLNAGPALHLILILCCGVTDGRLPVASKGLYDSTGVITTLSLCIDKVCCNASTPCDCTTSTVGRLTASTASCSCDSVVMLSRWIAKCGYGRGVGGVLGSDRHSVP